MATGETSNTRGGGKITKIATRFDSLQFAKIDRIARDERRTFANMVRVLVDEALQARAERAKNVER
jgi:hypothetical protein